MYVDIYTFSIKAILKVNNSLCMYSDHVFFGDLPRLSERELSLSLIYWDGLIYLIVDTKTLPVNMSPAASIGQCCA